MGSNLPGSIFECHRRLGPGASRSQWLRSTRKVGEFHCHPYYLLWAGFYQMVRQYSTLWEMRGGEQEIGEEDGRVGKILIWHLGLYRCIFAAEVT